MISISRITTAILSLLLTGLLALPVQAQETPAQARDEIQTPDATVYVDGLACPFCAYGLEKKLKNLDAIQTMEVQLEKGRVLLTFKENRMLTKDEIQQAVKKAGFTARKIEFADASSSASASS